MLVELKQKAQAIIPRDQMWFYSKEWQKGEMEAQQQIDTGKVSIANSKAELLAGLGLDEE